MMSEYYRNAASVSRALDGGAVARHAGAPPQEAAEEDLGRGVMLFDEHVTMRDRGAAPHGAGARARGWWQRRSSGARRCSRTRGTRSRARAPSPRGARSCEPAPRPRGSSWSLVATSKETKLRAGSVVRELHDLGLLLAMIPEFSPVVGRTHHDMYHVYTVDVHSVAAVGAPRER